jgi:hypothetical protein
MSKAFIESFFPAVAEVLKESSPALYDTLLPDDVAHLCPEVSVGAVRNPVLAVCAIFGIIIGLLGALSQNPLWSMGFGCFGLMNIVALPLHCFDPAGLSGLWWMLDCLFTGLSSSALTAASLGQFNASKQTNRRKILRVAQYAWLVGSSITATLVVASLLWSPAYQREIGQLPPSTALLLELWYLGPTVVTGWVVCPQVLRSMWGLQGTKVLKKGHVAITVCFGGAGVALMGLHLDPFFCRTFGVRAWDALMAPTLLFMGCDLCFFGLYLWLKLLRDADGVLDKRKSR